MSGAPVRDDVTMYWGVASGSSHAALHNHYEGDPFFQDAPTPTHAMVSWRTAENQVWAGPTWMIDSGGAPQTIIQHGGHPDTVHDYLGFVANPRTRYGDDLANVDVRYFALRDWPCEPEVRNALGLTTEQLQHRTLVDHINTMNAYDDRNIDVEPMAVLQGWRTQDYLDAIDQYRDHGLITDKIAIGTLCTRSDPAVIRNTGWRVARNLPGRCSIHGFGVKGPALGEPDALRIFDSLDTAAWNISLRQATKTGIEVGPPGGSYSDWVDWDDDGNPRSTARNMWINYRAYARRLADMEAIETPHDVRIVTLDAMFREVGELAPEGTRQEGYIVAECPCGQIIDPGAPDPLEHGEPHCRHCERAERDIFSRRIGFQDDLQRRGEPTGRQDPASPETQETEQMGLEGLKDDIRERSEGK